MLAASQPRLLFRTGGNRQLSLPAHFRTTGKRGEPTSYKTCSKATKDANEEQHRLREVLSRNRASSDLHPAFGTVAHLVIINNTAPPRVYVESVRVTQKRFFFSTKRLIGGLRTYFHLAVGKCKTMNPLSNVWPAAYCIEYSTINYWELCTDLYLHKFWIVRQSNIVIA